MRSCREGPEHLSPTLLAFFGFASSKRVTPFSRVTRGHQPSRLLSNRLSGKTQAKSSLKALTFMPFSCEKLARGINLCLEGINLRSGALTPVPPLGYRRVSGKERDQKLYLQPTCTYPGRRNLHEQLGNETRSGDTAGDCQGGYLNHLRPFLGSVPFAASRVGALSLPCALGVPMSRGSNVPVLRLGFQCLGIPMSRGRGNLVELIKSWVAGTTTKWIPRRTTYR